MGTTDMALDKYHSTIGPAPIGIEPIMIITRTLITKYLTLEAVTPSLAVTKTKHNFTVLKNGISQEARYHFTVWSL